MSRLLQLAVAAVSALALSTVTAPIDQFDTGYDAGPKRIGNWCC